MMTDQIWSWLLGGVGLVGFILAGRLVWWSWYVNIMAQGLWFAYSIFTEQWGFFVSAIVYTVVFAKNAAHWTSTHYQTKEQ